MDSTTIAPDTYPDVPLLETYTIGIPRTFLAEGIDPDVMAVFNAHIAQLEAQGHTIVDVELPLFKQGLAAYYISIPAEVSSNLARYDGMRYGLSVPGETLLDVYENTRAQGFGAEVKRRILLGTYVLSSGYYDAYYAKAEALRDLMRAELREVFSRVDLILTPSAPTPAFKLGEISDPVALYAQDIFTVPVNLTGVPAISIPGGTVEREGVSLPVGVQYIGPHGGDMRLFDIGKRIYDSNHS
jgi:aspartyl-tRNA(Asn)/glutamyl-tRNA(Gln) amidotransferase subunit A